MIVTKRNKKKEKFSPYKLLNTIIRLFGYVDKKVTPEDEMIAGTISGKFEYQSKKSNTKFITSEDIRDYVIKELTRYGRGDVAKIFDVEKNTFKNKDDIEG